MRVVIQRVSEAEVRINNRVSGAISRGLLILLGIENDDTEADGDWLARKISNLRIFPDANAVMNRSMLQDGGDALVVSQFTLHASTKKGHRPSYIKAARPDVAIPLYEAFMKSLSECLGKPVASGEFGADMKVSLVNDGPVTIIIDSKTRE